MEGYRVYWHMLFLGHLIIGLIIGFILYEFFHSRSIIIFCALGSVLPDVVDKPLGHIIFSSGLDNGKIFFPSLPIVLLFFITGASSYGNITAPVRSLSLHPVCSSTRLWT